MTEMPPIKIPLYTRLAGKYVFVGEAKIPLDVTITDIEHETGRLEARCGTPTGVKLSEAVKHSIEQIFGDDTP